MPSFPLGATLLACVVCLGVRGQPCLMRSAGRMGGQPCLIASLVACLWNSGAVKGLVAGWGAGPWRTGPEAVPHHGSGPLSVFVQFRAPWGWGLEGRGEMVLGGRAARASLRGSLLDLNPETCQANAEKLV